MARGPFAAGAENPSANPTGVETVDVYLTRLASAEAVPGGGSAAALTGALAAALVAMVARIRATPESDVVASADRLRSELDTARLRDELAFSAVVAAQALPKTDDVQRGERSRALEAALRHAAEEPLHTAALAVQVLRLADDLTRMPLGALASDVGCAAEFAGAALAAAAYNVRINHRYMHDEAAVAKQAAALSSYEAQAQSTIEGVRARVDEALAKR